jgi:hypothetical protein
MTLAREEERPHPDAGDVAVGQIQVLQTVGVGERHVAQNFQTLVLYFVVAQVDFVHLGVVFQKRADVNHVGWKQVIPENLLVLQKRVDRAVT